VKIGVISDTHGYFNRALFSTFDGVEMILHAGDIGASWVIQQLERIAPVVAVRGNADKGLVADRYPQIRTVEIAGRRICLVHHKPTITDFTDGLIGPDGVCDHPDIVVFGHTHRTERYWENGILFFNPGIAAYARGDQIATVGILTISEDDIKAEIVRLNSTSL